MFHLGLNAAVSSFSIFTRYVFFKIAAVTVGAFIGYWLNHVALDYYYRRLLDKKRNTKISKLAQAKDAFAEYLAQRKIPQNDIEMITQLPLHELIEKLKKQELPPAYVLLAYQHKAFRVDKELNCVVEFLYPEFTDVNLKGPLAGAPVSLKECIGIKGFDTCVGCACYVDHASKNDAVALQLIRSLGGVPFVRTTVPQTMMSTQCSNPITGVTLNPLRKDRTPHGSSGGEGALVGGGGSPLGFGTDVGGSVRLPAAMCGVVGFKPTTRRLSYRNMSIVSTAKPISPTWGPICRDVATCQMVMEALFNSPVTRSVDPECPPVPFNQVPKDRRLRIGYFLKLDDLVPVPAVRRALLHVRDKLIARGHELVEWEAPFTAKEYMSLFLKSIFADGCSEIKRCVAHDKLDPCIRRIYQLSVMPWYRRWWLKFKLNLTGSWESLAVVNAVGGFSSVADLESHLHTLQKFRWRILDSLRAKSLDVILCPVAGFAAALPINPPYSTTGMLTFQNLANTLNAPAGCMPSGCVVEERDVQVLEQAVNGHEIQSSEPQEAEFYKGYRALSPLHRHMLPLQRGTEGLPIPVQFMSPPWQDELCLHAMREAELALQAPTSPLHVPGGGFAPLKSFL
uniref:Amidase domain-containing protein n=1 Tax=Mesocestoides corti TaxID=53468 RepID=A0A5K3FE31_MESCO